MYVHLLQGCIEYERGRVSNNRVSFPFLNHYFMFMFNFFFVEPIHKYIYVLYRTHFVCTYMHFRVFGFSNNED